MSTSASRQATKEGNASTFAETINYNKPMQTDQGNWMFGGAKEKSRIELITNAK